MGIDIDDVLLVEESSVTVRGYRHRTTIPRGIFKILKLKDKDKLRWILLKDGAILVRKVNQQQLKLSEQ